MNKKLIISLFVVILSIAGFSTTGASAAESDDTFLGNGAKTSTTSRITVKSGEKLNIRVQGFPNTGNFAYAIFKNGSRYQDYVGGKDGVITHTLNPGTGDYSLRLYCGLPTNLKNNCSATGVISSKK